jgi:thioredoxin reductase (NADPH)
MAEDITLYGTLWCSDCKRAKQFFAEQRVPNTFVDVERDAEGLRFVEQVNGGKHIIPTIVFGSTKQAASAAGEGAAAALAIRRYVEPLAGGMPVVRSATTE